MRHIKVKIKTFFIITVVCASSFLIGINAIFAASVFNDQYGVFYRHGRVFGKIIHYDPERDLVIVLGSIFVSEPGGQWRRVESRKFHLVKPAGNDLRETLADSAGRTAGVEGQLTAWPGQKEEILEARSVDFHDCRIETPPWYAFGVTIRPEKIYKFNLNSVAELVDVLAGLRQAADIPQNARLTEDELSKRKSQIIGLEPEDQELSIRVKREFEKSWNGKWCVARDRQAEDELRAGVGGWQFYQGLLGYGNSYRDITAFMEAVRPGGGTSMESGPAVMCAYIAVERDRFGKIVKVTASGALYDSVSGLMEAMKNPAGLNLETWRLEGWGQETAEMMEGKLCWLSGSRVLVYETDPETGRSYLVDQYFALDRYLTRDGFENVLDICKGVIVEGGI
ncbi:MAG: hypothetical protein K6T65_11225 [Peptococcaceae bacterium]|nr:hypothetical protein [Peptococcaceae bacterium]